MTDNAMIMFLHHHPVLAACWPILMIIAIVGIVATPFALSLVLSFAQTLIKKLKK